MSSDILLILHHTCRFPRAPFRAIIRGCEAALRLGFGLGHVPALSQRCPSEKALRIKRLQVNWDAGTQNATLHTYTHARARSHGICVSLCPYVPLSFYLFDKKEKKEGQALGQTLGHGHELSQLSLKPLVNNKKGGFAHG
ncbi:hypothetical protein [Marinovum algicola]|uniref:hypothetical protein n=1 Tax=Marinovum algicola TaxID=42444 RepID=UPI003B522A6E